MRASRYFWFGLLLYGISATVLAKPRVLVVLGYHESMPASMETKRGIDTVLSSVADITYYYLNIDTDVKASQARAKKAYQLYNRLMPDGVIAIDDDVQSLFVLPYLAGKVKTPVIFAGINATPDMYQYPATNVSGIIERAHIDATIVLAQQVKNNISRIGFLTNKLAAGKYLLSQIHNELGDYSVGGCFVRSVDSMADIIALVERQNGNCDALLLAEIEGIVDSKHRPMTYKQIADQLRRYRIPILGLDPHHIESGAMGGVHRAVYQQGVDVATMLLKAIEGTPLNKLPIEYNNYGRRMLNIGVTRSMGIVIKPDIVRTVDLLISK